jgi:hypothetical protein
MNWNIAQNILVALLVILLGALTDPFMYWMPSMPEMLALTLSCVGLAAWIGLAAREGAIDERDGEHRMFAGRVAYLGGVGVLTIALLVQGLNHTIDPWIPMALASMVVLKIGARWYADRFW